MSSTSHHEFTCTDINADLTINFYGSLGIGHGAHILSGECRTTGRKVAIKTLKDTELNRMEVFFHQRAAAISDFVVPVHRVYLNEMITIRDFSSNLLIVMEPCGVDGFKWFKSHPNPSETMCRAIIRQLAQGLSQLHSNGIVHNDIKLENILIDEKDVLHLCDFEFAGEDGAQRVNLSVTEAYATPELVLAKQTRRQDKSAPLPKTSTATDMWCLGVLMYILIERQYPFGTAPKHKDLISGCCPVYCNESWSKFSSDARRVVQSLLNKDQSLRMTAEALLLDPWLAQ